MDVATLSIAVDSRDVNNATKAMERMTEAGSGLEGVAKKLAVAFGLYKLGDVIKDIALLSARYETLGVAMNTVGNNAGHTALAMAKYQDELQATGISAIEARNNLTKMAAANLDLAQASKLARVAQDAAVIGNVNSSEAFATLVQGIQTGRTEILHTLGIMPNFEAAYKRLGAGATEHMKAQARLNAVLVEGEQRAGAYEAAMGTAGKQLKSMERYFEDLQVSAGDVFKPSLEAAVQALNQGFADMKAYAKENREELDLLGNAAGGTTTQLIDLGKALVGVGQDVTEDMDGLTAFRRIIQGIGGIVAATTDAVNGLRAGALNLMSDNLNQASKVLLIYSQLAPKLGLSGNATVAGALAGSLSLRAEDIQKRSDAIANNQLATEKWIESLEASTPGKKWKDKLGDGGAARERAEALEAARKVAEDYARTVSGVNIELTKERLSLEKGALAAYDFELKMRGLKDADRLALDAKKSTNDVLRETIALEKKLMDERLKPRDVNPDIQRGLFGSFQTAMDLGDPGREARSYLEEQKAALERWKDVMPVENYRKAVENLTMAELKLKAEHGNIWAGMGMVVTSYADQSADAMMRFINGTKSGFREMTVSMLLDMEKLLLKKKLMEPLMDGLAAGLGTIGDGGGWGSFAAAFGAAWGGKHAMGGNVTGGTVNLVGEQGPELFVPRTSGTIIPNHALGGQTVITSQVIVSVDSNGNATSQVNSKGAEGFASDLRESVEPMVLAVIHKHMRPGGALNPVN